MQKLSRAESFASVKIREIYYINFREWAVLKIFANINFRESKHKLQFFIPDEEEFKTVISYALYLEYESHFQNHYIYVEDCVETVKYHDFVFFSLFHKNKISRMSGFENFASINFRELLIWEFFKT